MGGTPYRATGSSPEAAWAKLQEKIAQDGRGPPGGGRPDGITVAAYVRAWLERRRLEIGRGLEARSWGNHERAVNLHLLPAIGHLTLTELTAAHLERHYARLLGPPAGLAVKTVRDVNGTLRLALRRLPRDFGLPNVATDVDLPRRERGLTQYPLRADEMRRFARAAAQDRDAALWLLASYVPSRSGELRDLKWADLDLANRVLHLQRSLQRSADAGRVLHEKDGGKTAANQRVLELTDALVAALLEHRRRQDGARRAAGRAWVPHDLIFCTRYGTPLLPGALLRRFRRLLEAAGLPAHHRLHDLRHTAVQSLLLGGVPLPEVSGAAGHASPAVTSALYAHAVRRVPARLLGALGEFYRTGHAEHEAESGSAPAPAPDPRPPDGQTRALTAAQLAEAQRLRARGWTQARLAGRYGVSPSTVNRALRGITGRPGRRPGQPG